MTRIADALEDCLEAVAAGRAEVAECPLCYPDLAAELRTLLCVCQRLHAAFSVEPSPPYARAARERFLARMAGRSLPDTAMRRRRGQPRPAKTDRANGGSSPVIPGSSSASGSDG